jgi:class 3 adenylate cyclase
MNLPETRYAKSGDVHIAYQLNGEGPFDLVFIPGFVSNVELDWEQPVFAHMYTRLAGFSRLIRFDKRGTGLSDRVYGVPSLEERMDDVRAVMDAAGSREAALFGVSEGGPMSILFAATYPDRCRALVLYGTFAHYESAIVRHQAFAESRAWIVGGWGTGITAEIFEPTRASDAEFRRSLARWERLSASPAAAVAIMDMNREIDVRPVLPAVRVPTLVLHHRDDPRIRVEAGRYIAAHIPGAKYVELPGRDHRPSLAESERLIDEVEEFLTGACRQIEPDRVLATVLFTDIVGSTKKAIALGDRAWRSLLDRHDETARQEIARFRGRVVKNLGDGFLATFDGPARAVRCAAAIVERVRPLGIAVRCGLHTGEIELRGADIGGIAVHIAERIAELSESGEVLVSNTVRDLVAGSGLSFADRGGHRLKGLPEERRLFALTP